MTTTYDLDQAADHLPPVYEWSAMPHTGLRFHDMFCGAGGSSLGMTGAGFELAIGLNHWKLAIETHAANFRDADHACADVTALDLRKLPVAEVLWASPICTEASPAGGTASWEPDLFNHDDPMDSEGMVRTRATFYEVLRATELWRYEAILVENVPDVATRWGPPNGRMFWHWVEGMKLHGYVVQFVSVSAAHIGGPGNPWAPQWRDRLYMVFTKEGAPLPDVEPRPLAHCFTCAQDVMSIQSWKKPGPHIGKYRQQYVYVCPNRECRHAQVEPYVAPAASIIDWTNTGVRIGDKKSRRKDGLPLAPKTLARIQAGLEMFAQPITAEVAGNTFERAGSGYVRAWPAEDAPVTAQTTTATKALATLPPTLVTVNHGGDDGRPLPADQAPLPTRTVKLGEGLATGPDGVPDAMLVKHYTPRGRDTQMVKDPRTEPVGAMTTTHSHSVVTLPFTVPAGGTWRDDPAGVDVPMGTRTTCESDALITPPGAFIDVARTHASPHSVDEPTTTLSTGRNHGLVCPPLLTEHRRNGEARPVDDEPASTITAGGNHHSVTVPPGAEDAFYVKNHGGNARDRDMCRSVRTPLGALTTKDPTSLVIPYRRGQRAHRPELPIGTVATHKQHGLAHLGVDLMDCRFRMLTAEEHLAAQRFHPSYRVLGNSTERTFQAGNAVPSNVAQWLASCVAIALSGAPRRKRPTRRRRAA